MRNTTFLHTKENRKDISLLGLLTWRPNYACFEYIFMVPKVFEPLKFYYIIVNYEVGTSPPLHIGTMLHSLRD